MLQGLIVLDKKKRQKYGRSYRKNSAARCDIITWLGHIERMKDKFNKSRDRFVRITYGVIGLLLLAVGALHIISGRLVYQNYKGLGVFAPIAVIAGLIVLYGVIFRWQLFRDADRRRNKEDDKDDSTKKHKPKHWH